MTNDHTANGFFDQADQDCIWGIEEDLIAEAELELAADGLLYADSDSVNIADDNVEPEHDHAPGQGCIFTCPACIANSDR